MKKYRNLLSFDIISDAIKGNSIAMQNIIKYYDGYISTVSLNAVYDEENNKHFVMDKELKDTLVTAILIAITKFKI